jgi:hypothetical protein
MPGPGNYDDSARQFGKGTQAFSIKGKFKDINRLNSPGPGAYEALEKNTKTTN